LLVFLFENDPSADELNDRIGKYVADGATVEGAKICAVYYGASDHIARDSGRTQYPIVIMSQSQLLKSGLKLDNYVRDLLQRFNKDKLGGTNATLKETFVDPHVQGRGDLTRYPLSTVLAEWLVDSSRRQLAITAEYGRGKSTAMLNSARIGQCAM
jgi:hypothetical protein